MFRIVEKKTGKILYGESICNANKAKMIQRCSKFLSKYIFENEKADKDYCVEFANFSWNNNTYNRRGYSDYGYHWSCTTVIGLKYAEDGKHLEYGEHISGRKLDFTSKPKGGAWGEMMIDMGMA